MIDWPSVAACFMWILALSGMLAVLSYAEHLSRVGKTPLRQILRQDALQVPFLWSSVLFCAGIAASDRNGWSLAWGGLALLLARQAWPATLRLAQMLRPHS